MSAAEHRWLDLIWTDLVGRSHVLRTSRQACEEDGVEVPLARLVQGFGEEPQSAGKVELIPDWSSERALPWDSAVSVCIADVHEDGAPSPLCVRGFLRSVAEQAAKDGLVVEAAVELEFYLVDPGSGRPIYGQIDNYSLSRVEAEPVIAAFRNQMRAMAVAVEASNPEYSGGQFEVNLSRADLLAAADQATLARHFTGTLARRHQLDSTYMSKPWSDQSSSGVHVHQSLWQGERNLFYDPAETLSGDGRSYLAGLLASVPEFALIGSPTPNGFHRRADGSFAPTVASWATDNRTTAVRAVLGGESGTRIEHRDGGAECNLYLTMGAQVLAGLDGMARGASPPEAIVGNAYEQDLPTLPRTYVEAYERLRDSELAARLLPVALLDEYLAVLAPEVELAIVSSADWERARYAEVPLR